MKPQIIKIFIILFILLTVSSCIPTSPKPPTESIASIPPSATAIILEKPPVSVETSTPLQSPPEIPAEPSYVANPISMDNISGLSESGRAFQTNPQKLVWSNDVSTFAVISMKQRQVVVFDTQSLTTSAAFSVEEPGLLLDFSSDGKTAAVTTDLMSLTLYDVTNNSLIKTIEIPEMVYDATFSPDGSIVAIALFDEIAATLWEVPGGKLITKLTGFETAAPVYDISFSDDGNSIIWHARGGVQLQDITTGQMGPPFDHEDFVSGIAVSPDGQMLATGAAGTLNDAFTPLVTLWDTNSGQELKILTTKTVANNLDFSPDSRLLAGNVTNRLIIWDTESGEEVFSKDIAAESITSVSFSPDGKNLAITATDNSIQIWQVVP